MATIKIFLRADKAKKSGELPLYIRMTIDRKSKYISLRKAVFEKHWDADRQRVKKSHPNSGQLNAYLAQKRAEIEALALEIETGKTKADKGIRSTIEGDGEGNYFEYGKQVLLRLETEGRFATARNYKAVLKGFEEWLSNYKGIKTLRFSRLNRQLAMEYKVYCQEVRGCKANTVKSKFNALKSIASRARREGVAPKNYAPFAEIRFDVTKPQKAIPSPEEMARIEALPIDPGSPRHHVRNLYLFCANMAGLRFADAVTIRWAQVRDGRLHWQTSKTAKQRLVYIPQKAMAILDSYREPGQEPGDFVFPFLRGKEQMPDKEFSAKIRDANCQCNRHLKKICKSAGLKQPYSFHSSRHYFATDSLRRGMRVEVLQHLLTHSSLNQTMEYVRIANEDMDAAMMAYEAALQG